MIEIYTKDEVRILKDREIKSKNRENAQNRAMKLLNAIANGEYNDYQTEAEEIVELFLDNEGEIQ